MTGIITHYDVHNHGAILQLLALIKHLESTCNIGAKALQFDKNYDFMPRSSLSKYKLSLKSIGVYLDFLRERGIGSLLFNYKKYRLLHKFKADHHLIGEFYTEYSHLDNVIVGSDEVFALHTGVTPCFFGHALPTNNVVAYAGCFGPTKIEDVLRLHCDRLIRSGLSGMSAVSVRDTNSQSIVQELTGTNPPIVLDPVLLYGYEKELSQMKSPCDEPYMVVYAYDMRMNDVSETASIIKFAKNHNLKIVSPGFYHSWVDLNVNVDPLQLLGWFKYAQYVVTDTFHGSIVSMINHRNFAVYCRDNANKLMDLLTSFSLDDRVVSPNENNISDVLSREIDYIAFQSRLESYRTQSSEWLKNALDEKN